MDSPSVPSVGSLTAVLTPMNFVRLLGLCVAYYVLRALYNISPLHPLYRFPGPRKAALTYLYEAYYDWWRVGRYGIEIKKMHDRYGPIVRINPDELHCNDPRFTDEIYASGGRVRDKWQHQLNTGAAGPVSVTGFSTVPHELHRLRKGALSKFFSRAQMLKLEGEVHDYAQRTADKMLRFAAKASGSASGSANNVFDVKEAFNCFTADIVSQYAFGEPMGFVDGQDGWEPNFATWVKSFFKSAYMMRHNAPVRKLAGLAPMLADYMPIGDDIKAVLHQMTVVIPRYVQAAIANPDNGRVFAEVMQSKALPESEKSLYRLSGEGFNFLLAGTETTAATLTIITYHLLDKPAVYAKLVQALDGVDPLHPHWTDLEQRPYLWAVLHEALRMMPGVSHRSARIARHEDLAYVSADGQTRWVIPRGTPIGMTSMINHYDAGLFPDPGEFVPERWLKPDGSPDHALERNLIAFGRGSRACIGTHLAYCELYVMAAVMALRVLPRARLHATTLEDITYDHDLIVGQTKKGSISVRIAID